LSTRQRRIKTAVFRANSQKTGIAASDFKITQICV